MSSEPTLSPKARTVTLCILGLLAIGFVTHIAKQEPRRPRSPRILAVEQEINARKPPEQQPSQELADDALVELLLAQNLKSRRFDFSALITSTTGHSLIPLNTADSNHQAFIQVISNALDQTLERMNTPDSPTHSLRRINEASRYIEDNLAQIISTHPDFECGPPKTLAGKRQRSGYPDLEIHHLPSGKIAYLDPKLVEDGHLTNTQRTFYYTPKTNTAKVTQDALHLVAGIEHDGNNGEWKYLRWHLVDLSQITLKLKAEFHASNFDLYSPEALIRSSSK